MQKAVETYRDRFAGQYPVFDGKKIMYCYKRLAQNQVCGLCSILNYTSIM